MGSGADWRRAKSEREMYPDYPRYGASVYPPPTRTAVRRRAHPMASLLAGLLAALLIVSVALAALGLIFDPQLITRLVPLTAMRVTGTIYGENLAQRETGHATATPLAGAHIGCDSAQASADAQGHYTLSLLKGRYYSCQISAALHVTAQVTLAPRLASAYHLDIGPAITSQGPAGSAGSASSAGCAATSAGETCPALALRGGALSGQVTDLHTYAPIANAHVLCWDDADAAQVNPDAPARYDSVTDAQGRYSLPDTPPGPYLCVANQQGAPQRVTVAPAATTTLNFVECGSHCGGMTYHAGPVMHTFTAYVIFWAPTGVRFEPNGSDARFQSLVRQYLSDVGGSRFYELLTQYWDQQGPVRNVATLGGTYVDMHAYPHAGTRADPLRDSDITAEMRRVREQQGWRVSSDTAFIVLTGYGVQECATFSDGQACSFPGGSGDGSGGFCAYHSFTPYFGGASDGASGPSYTPYLYVADTSACAYLPTFDSGLAPYGDPTADVVINSLSHEQFEAVTNPETHGWYDGDPGRGEIGDKCETNFGAVDGDGATVTLTHGHSYALQEEYSDRVGGCAYQ